MTHLIYRRQRTHVPKPGREGLRRADVPLMVHTLFNGAGCTTSGPDQAKAMDAADHVEPEPTTQQQLVYDMDYYAQRGYLADDTHAQLEGVGAGDSYLLFNVCPTAEADVMFAALRDETAWQTMDHRGGAVPRLISIQASIEGDVEPIYRHPAEAQPATIPWTPMVDRLRHYTMARVHQPLNHALVQWYRHGLDYISEHSDKTLDIRRGSLILNLRYPIYRFLCRDREIAFCRECKQNHAEV